MQQINHWVKRITALIALAVACLPSVALALMPGLDASMPDLLPVVEEVMIEQREVTLYFRMQGENLLAAETRTVFFPREREEERVLIESLIEGPSPGLLDLTGLFPTGTEVKRVWHNKNLLTVTLSSEFLNSPSDAPTGWENDAAWRVELMVRRQLALASIVNTITEETDFTAIQFLVADQSNMGDDAAGRRFRRGEIYLDASDGQLLAPVVRNEHFLMTHYNTGNIIMESWKGQAYDRLFRLVAQESGQRPAEAAFMQEMISMGRALVSYTMSAGTVSENGQKAVIEVSFEYQTPSGSTVVQNFPLRLAREQGIWKINYSELQRLLEAE